MKAFLPQIFTTLALLCGFSVAQNATPPPTNATAPQGQAATPASPSNLAQTTTPRIAPGSVIPVQLTRSIDAKKAKTGDEVEAKVTQDMKAVNGEVIVPKDTRVVGWVTEAQARNKEQKESQVAITFDRAVMKTGGDVNVPMSIQAIIAPSYLSANNSPGAEATGQPQTSANGTAQGNPRNGGMGGAQSANPSAAAPSEDTTGNGAHQPITGKTEGVLGIPDMKLSSADTAQGSVVTSEKNNVKLESGTMMLLRVGPASMQH